jgi:two-component system sensor histidine kinase HydH
LKLVEGDARTRGVEVTSTVPAGLPPIVMDADRINQVLLNLYLNAIQAMENGGTLSVEVARDEHLKQTMIRVADTGPGIDPSDQERVFDPYFTTKPDGTGLGLAIVHKIMEAHGGDVDVHSSSSTGTVVILSLPDMAEDEDAS